MQSNIYTFLHISTFSYCSSSSRFPHCLSLLAPNQQIYIMTAPSLLVAAGIKRPRLTAIAQFACLNGVLAPHCPAVSLLGRVTCWKFPWQGRTRAFWASGKCSLAVVSSCTQPRHLQKTKQKNNPKKYM